MDGNGRLTRTLPTSVVRDVCSKGRAGIVGPEYTDPSSNTWLADATFPDGLGYGYFELIGSAPSQASQSPLGIAGTDAAFDVVEPGLESRLGSA